MNTKRTDPEKRFFKKVNLTDICWLWIGSLAPGGYGSFWDGDKLCRAHRWAFSYFKKQEIKPGNFICHKCDIPSCVNPDHLFQGTNQENVQDSISKGRFHTKERIGKLSEFLKGNKLGKKFAGENHNQVKLTEKQAIEILLSKETGPSLAAKYGVNKNSIYNLRSGYTWNTPKVKSVRAEIERLEKN